MHQLPLSLLLAVSAIPGGIGTVQLAAVLVLRVRPIFSRCIAWMVARECLVPAVYLKPQESRTGPWPLQDPPFTNFHLVDDFSISGV